MTEPFSRRQCLTSLPEDPDETAPKAERWRLQDQRGDTYNYTDL